MAVEPVSTTLAAVGLAALVTTCVDCFEYIQFGRQFGKDFQGCLATIDVVKIRFVLRAANRYAYTLWKHCLLLPIYLKEKTSIYTFDLPRCLKPPSFSWGLPS
jgi:hypothetical protein